MKVEFTSNYSLGYVDEKKEFLFTNMTEYLSTHQFLGDFKHRFCFGDGNYSDIINYVSGDTQKVTHIYSEPGEYDVSLIVWNEKSSEIKIKTKKKYIRIRDIKSPSSDFMIIPHEPIEGDDHIYNIIEKEVVRLTNMATGDVKRTIWESENILTESRDIVIRDLKTENSPVEVRIKTINERGESITSFFINIREPKVESIVRTDGDNVYLMESIESAELWQLQETIGHDFAKRLLEWRGLKK